MLVFVILECGLYHNQKRIYACKKCGRSLFKTRRYDSALSTHFFFSTAAKFLRTESEKCPALPSREPGTCMLCHSINLQVVKVHLFNQSLHFRSSFRKPKRFSLALHLGKCHFKDISSIRIFCKDKQETLKYVEFSELKKMKFKKNTHLSLSLSLSCAVAQW